MGSQGYFRFMLVMAAIVVAVLPAAGCSVSQGSPGPAANPAVSASPREGPQEGIKVHGQWTIEVTNPDGSLAGRREFENALTGYGRIALASFLGRKNSVGSWQIILRTALDGTSPFVSSGGDGVNGFIGEGGVAGFNYFTGLLVDVPIGGDPNAGKLVLRGVATAQRNGTINGVVTAVAEMSPTVPPSSYASGGGTSPSLTTQTLSPAQNVSAGQQINVTVVISFS